MLTALCRRWARQRRRWVRRGLTRKPQVWRVSLLCRLAFRLPRDIMVTSGDLVESDLGGASAYAGLM